MRKDSNDGSLRDYRNAVRQFRNCFLHSEGGPRRALPNDGSQSPRAAVTLALRRLARYLREPRRGFLSSDCRTLIFLRLGLLITNVPLPRYSALNSLSSAKKVLL